MPLEQKMNSVRLSPDGYDDPAHGAGGLQTVPAGPGPAAPPERPARSISRQWWLRDGIRPYLVAGDVGAFAVADLVTGSFSALHLLVLLMTLVVFSLAGLYRSRLNLSLLDDAPAIAAAVLIGTTLQITVASLQPSPEAPSRQLLHAAVVLVAMSVVRFFAYAVVRHARRSGRIAHRTVILGAGEVGDRIAVTLLERREFGMLPVGFVDSAPPARPMALSVIGSPDDLEAVISTYDVRDVIIAFGLTGESRLVDVLRTCDRLDVQVFLVPRLFEMHTSKRDTDEIWGIPVVRIPPVSFRRPMWGFKRLVDIGFALGALVVLSPVLAVCALAVRREGGPGIIFRQERVSLGGQPFQVLKFRSLKPVDDQESQTNWNIKHDDRLGPVGRLMRATSLDELPQLWNILRGDMSLVGPRPERPHFVKQFSTSIPRYSHRHRVPAGLTGWSQAHGLRGDTSIEDRARFDNYYIENWSHWLDFKIVVKTLGQVVRRQGG